MADVSTDIASNVNITARRGDTFILELSALNTDGTDSDSDGVADTIDMTAAQYTGTEGTSSSSNTHLKRWQAKMTIADANSGDAKLSIFSPEYPDTAWATSNNVSPAPTTEGKWFGSSASEGGIDLSGTSTAAGKIKIKVPASYMAALEPGSYNYDFQVRKKIYVGLDAEITTWIYGTFIVTADITSGTS